MKKRLCLLLAAALVCTLLTGCGNDGQPDAGAGIGEGLYAAVDKEKLRVGVVYAGEPETDPAGCGAHEQGILEMQENLGLSDDQIIRSSGVDEQDPAAVRAALEELVGQGCQIIFATAEGYAEITPELAGAYPEVIFCQNAGTQSNGFNLIAYSGRIDQARYLSGVVAGMNTASGKIGYVAAGDSGAVTAGLNAFAMGAAAAAPDAQVLVRIIDTWCDHTAENQAAQALLALGCDVIAQHSGTLAPMLAAQYAGAYAIGYNVDAASRVPSAALTSVLWDWSVFYTQAVQQVIDGAWMGEDYQGSMQDGMVVLLPCTALCMQGTQDRVDSVREEFLTGSWDLFDGQTAYPTNDGRQVVQKADDYDSCDWYYQNIRLA